MKNSLACSDCWNRWKENRCCVLPILIVFMLSVLFHACTSYSSTALYDYTITTEEDRLTGTLLINKNGPIPEVKLQSFDWGGIILDSVQYAENQLSGQFKRWRTVYRLSGKFEGKHFKGTLRIGEDEEADFMAVLQSNEPVDIDRSNIAYLIPDEGVAEVEHAIDHAGIIRDQDRAAYIRGTRIYNDNCINCHGNEEVEGSIPLSTKFWEQPLNSGNDAYSIYQTLTRGVGSMPPQPTLTPRQKHDVALYIRERYIRNNPSEEFIPVSPGYLKGLPKGDSRGPDTKPYQPWADMDYGDFFINTYELVDEETGPERFHSPGPVPYEDEDYRSNNFAYKGIAVRLDAGDGGISKGRAWMIFDHDLMRVAGGWTGEGFIDWDAILLNDRHETYPRTVGRLHFETPVGPGWANPETGSFEDPRFTARDGRQFGPLPRSWADYKGLYHIGEHIIISYTVGRADIMEKLSMIDHTEAVIFTRTLNVSRSSDLLKLRVTHADQQVAIKGTGAALVQEEGYHFIKVDQNTAASFTIYISDDSNIDLNAIINEDTLPASLQDIIKEETKAHYPDRISSPILTGNDSAVFAVDILSPPFENPWNCRMKLSGIDFLQDKNEAVACATDGDVWLITGLLDNKDSLQWQRIGSGLFQPLGIKVIEEQIFVTCRDQIVRLRDLNGDRETDFYESFNHDHQVTDHFHEFAMGLQADKKGNLYYAKSGRHAREALIPRHGTLIKVSKDGNKSEIVATGFRAANGVCINPDGSFIVTDQQGYWNPMNRINWVEVGNKPKFYGNMWGYNPPSDTSRAAMEPPMVWVDMQFDRSPSELLWVDSKKWGPLNDKLLSFSYGYGKIQLVLQEEVEGQMQGGVIDLPDIKFLTGVMRGRFNPADEHLYACGMSAWGTSQLMKGGGLYRIRYAGNLLPVPIEFTSFQNGLKVSFAEILDDPTATEIANYKIETWDLVRSSAYGSDRYNRQVLSIEKVALSPDRRSVFLTIPEIQPVDVLTLTYQLKNENGVDLKGTLQMTIHNLSNIKSPI